MKPRLAYASIVATIALFLVLDGGAAAQLVNSKGQIRACVDRSGRMTILKSARKKKCKRGQKLLVWSQQGTTGAPGPAGPGGPAGAPGTNGANGNDGQQGAKGDTGPADGAAGGDLSGTYPNPTLGSGVVSLATLSPGLAALLPSADQVAALVGTSGTPGSANPYVTEADPRLTDSRAPSGTASGDLTGTYPGPTLVNGSIDSTNLFSSSLKDGTAGTAMLRSLGTTGTTAAAGNDGRFPTSGEKSALAGTNGTPGNANRYVTDSDSRLTNSRAPNGTAGGDLAGTYPSPTLATLPHIRTRQTVAQTFPANGNIVLVNLDQATESSGATFDNPNDEVDISRSGFYLITGEIVWTTNAAGARFLSLNATGGVGEIVADSRTAISGLETVQTVVGLAHLAAGNSVTMAAGQGTGGALTTTVFNGRSAQLSLTWVGN